MAEYQKQLDILEGWWHRYRLPIVVGLLGALCLGVIGYLVNAKHKKQRSFGAAQYEKILELSAESSESAGVKGGDVGWQVMAERLTQEVPKSVYASLASLRKAKKYVEEGKYNEALQWLDFVITNSPALNLRQTAGLRKARILIQLGKPQDALAVVNQLKNSNEYRGIIDEIRGDTLFALGKYEEADRAYRQAEQLQGGRISPLLRLKLQRS